MKPLTSLHGVHKKVAGKQLPGRIPFSYHVRQSESGILVAVPEKSLRELFEKFRKFFDKDRNENNVIRCDACGRKRYLAHWSLLYPEPLKESIGLPFEKKMDVLKPEFVVPTAHAVVAGIITYRMRFGKLLFKNQAVMTATSMRRGHPLCVWSTEEGIVVFPMYKEWYSDIGLAVARKPR